ncbi:hypothetical protein KAT92_03550 [Candidatus Babeliales bacterium]|nr:hypothetical protein [Candidatus Babeliales bacterium]
MRTKLLFAAFAASVISVSAIPNPFSKVLPKRKKFSTLIDLEHQAKLLPEYPKIDNNDYIKPDYSSFYKSLSPNIFKKTWGGAKNLWPNKKYATWSPDVLKKLLVDVTDERKMRSYQAGFTQKLTPPSSAHFVAWGNIHGSFHSFVRDLRELKNKGIINEDLTIAKPDHYLVFNGNVVDLSPFSMETLTAVLLLMKQNRHNAFYVRGAHESKNRWRRYGLGQELGAKVKKTKHYVAFESMLKDFFNTLPSALHLKKMVNGESKIVQISSLAEVNSESKSKPILCLSAETLNDSFSGGRGLRQVKTSDTVTGDVWRLFSSPTRVHRSSRQFFYDSFVIFTLNDSLKKSTLALHSRDTRQNGGFREQVYRLFG